VEPVLRVGGHEISGGPAGSDSGQACGRPANPNTQKIKSPTSARQHTALASAGLSTSSTPSFSLRYDLASDAAGQWKEQ
jgi:hypothetical protein